MTKGYLRKTGWNFGKRPMFLITSATFVLMCMSKINFNLISNHSSNEKIFKESATYYENTFTYIQIHLPLPKSKNSGK